MPNAVVKVGLTDVKVIKLDWTHLAGMPTLMLSPVLYLRISGFINKLYVDLNVSTGS